MLTSKNTVTEARGRLYGNWGLPIGIFTVLAIALLFLDNFLTFCAEAFAFPPPVKTVGFTVLILIFIITLAPLFYGMKHWFYTLSSGTILPAETVLTFYRTPFRTLSFFFVSSLPKLLLTAACFSPGFAFLWCWKNGILPEFFTIVIVVAVTALLAIAGAGIWIYCFLSGFLADFYFTQFPELSPRQCCALSRKNMHGNRFTVLDVLVNLSGWLLLCLAILPILYTFPLMFESFAIVSRRIMLEKSSHVCYNVNKNKGK